MQKGEFVLHELLPIMAGVVTALVAHGVGAPRLRMASVVAGSIVFGTLASFISGELLVSAAYLVFDIAQVLLTAIAATALLSWRRKSIDHPKS